jgi:hypothetical protein
MNCASKTHEPHGKRHGQATAGEQTLPLLFDLKLQAECVSLCGSGMNEKWAPAEDGLQLPLAALKRQ